MKSIPPRTEIHCLSLSCPEFRSVCCNAKSKEFTYFEGGGHLICSSCGIQYQGGKCIAAEIVKDNLENGSVKPDSLTSEFISIRSSLKETGWWPNLQTMGERTLNEFIGHLDDIIGKECLHLHSKQMAVEPLKWEIELEQGTPIAKFQKVRTDAISEMLDSKDEYGIYQTSRFFYKLDDCVRSLLIEEQKKIGKNILNMINENDKDIEIAINDLLNYADHLITKQDI